MYAVVETGGKQIRVSVGDTVKVEKIAAEVGQEVIFDKVLLLKEDGELKVGTPYIEGAKVRAVVVETAKADKVLVYRPPTKKSIPKLRGHRQWYTKVKIKEIIGG
ncbi:MAG: 50S ribosomal protein L21 [Thermodesulfovibrio sp.]|nr:50S ribosomal protein L21 [Thermodesulfovibrio sp.]